MMSTRAQIYYGTDVTDSQWALIELLLPEAKSGPGRRGRPPMLNRWFIKGVCRLRKLWVDAGYVGEALADWVRGLKRTYKIDLEVTDHQGKGFQVVAKRWVVERAFSWFSGYRRHNKDYEVLTRNSEAMIQISMIATLLRRVA